MSILSIFPPCMVDTFCILRCLCLPEGCKDFLLCFLFAYRSFIVFAFLLKCIIHFELIFFVWLRQGYDFILLHVDIQLFQHHMLKRQFMNCLGPLVENQLTVTVDSILVMILDICFLYCLFLLSLLSTKSSKSKAKSLQSCPCADDNLGSR